MDHHESHAPAELVAAQRATIAVADQVASALAPGMTEIEIIALANRILADYGASGEWTPSLAGVGEGNRVCNQDFGPTTRAIADVDLVYFDLTPDFDGWPGDYTRSVVIGVDPAREQLVADCLAIEQEIIAAARPGMPASELFAFASECFAREQLELLDLWHNIGHDLGRDAVVNGYIDAGNDTPMWGSWAIEPHVGRDGLGAKFEDLIWLGSDGVSVIR